MPLLSYLYHMKIEEIKTKEYNAYYGKYISTLPKGSELRAGFEAGHSTTVHFFNELPKNKLDFRYAHDKWSIKEVFQHLIDSERILIYRCFRIARHDKTALAGFDQNTYVDPSQASQKSIEALSNEFAATRAASISILNSVSDDDLQTLGHANGAIMSARSAAAIIIGHYFWHKDIIKKRYL